MRQALLVALILGISTLPIESAAQLPRGQPEAVGMSSTRLARIGPALRRYVDQNVVSGLVTLVVRDGRIVELDTAGWRDVASRSPMRRNTVFRIASMTKAVTSVAAMMLVEEGRLRLGDSVSKFIPEFSKTRVLAAHDSLVAPNRPMTVHDLLTHRSGLVYGFIDTSAVGKAYRGAGVNDGVSKVASTEAENMVRLAAQPLASQPGHEWRYSIGVDVLGRIVEVASGLTLAEFFSSRIFGPLKMNDTGFLVPDEKLERLATSYTSKHDSLRAMATGDTWGDGRLRLGLFGGPGTRGSATFFSGGAGLFSTADDYARFAQMLLNGGTLEGTRLLSPKTVELMRSDATGDLKDPLGQPGLGFGLGFAVVTDLGATGTLGSVGTYSWGGILGTSYWIDPKERMVGIMMMQLFPNRDDVNETFQTLAYAAVVK
jgi:CubicO group peptidase (beta-lactamase class C family)